MAVNYGMGLELQRSLHRLLGMKIDSVQRVIIDIGISEPIKVYVQQLMSEVDASTVVEAIRLEHPDVRQASVIELDLERISQRDYPSNPADCTGDDTCTVRIAHVHYTPVVYANNNGI